MTLVQNDYAILDCREYYLTVQLLFSSFATFLPSGTHLVDLSTRTCKDSEYSRGYGAHVTGTMSAAE